MKYRQYELQADLNTLICWLEDDFRLVRGRVLTLKETGKKKWTIVRRYETVHEGKTLYQPWKVGGLG